MCELQSLLKVLEVEEVYDDLKNAGILFEHIQYLNERDIENAVGNIGVRAKFREKLFAWRKNQTEVTPTSPSSSYTDNNEHIGFCGNNLLQILERSACARNVIDFYRAHQKLTEIHRPKIIDAILQFCNEKNIVLRTSDFAEILKDIAKQFPNEAPYLVLVTFKSLEYLDANDIARAVSNAGHCAEFREKLFAWRKPKENMLESPISRRVIPKLRKLLAEQIVRRLTGYVKWEVRASLLSQITDDILEKLPSLLKAKL